MEITVRFILRTKSGGYTDKVISGVQVTDLEHGFRRVYKTLLDKCAMFNMSSYLPYAFITLSSGESYRLDLTKNHYSTVKM